MSDFKITVKEKITPVISCFIPYPQDDDGGGWSYTATIEADTILLDSGRLRIDYLDSVLLLLDEAVKTDTKRSEEFGSPALSFMSYFDEEDDEEFQADIERLENKAVSGINPEDVWISSTGVVDRKWKTIATITLLRAGSRYIVMESGSPSLSFDCWEIEGLTALLRTAQEHL